MAVLLHLVLGGGGRVLALLSQGPHMLVASQPPGNPALFCVCLSVCWEALITGEQEGTGTARIRTVLGCELEPWSFPGERDR